MGMQELPHRYSKVDLDFISGKRGITNRKTGEFVTLEKLGDKIAAFRDKLRKAIADAPNLDPNVAKYPINLPLLTPSNIIKFSDYKVPGAKEDPPFAPWTKNRDLEG